MAIKQDTRTPAPARTSASTAARRTQGRPQPSPAASDEFHVPESGDHQSERAQRLASYADTLHRESVGDEEIAAPELFPAVADAADHLTIGGELWRRQVFTVRAGASFAGEDLLPKQAALTFPVFLTAFHSEAAEKAEEVNAAERAAGSGREFGVHEVVYTRSTGLVQGTRPCPELGEDSEVEMMGGRRAWADFGAFDLALAEAAAFEQDEDREDVVYLNACELQRTLLWPQLMRLFDEETAAERAGMYRDEIPTAAMMFGARMMRVGLMLGRREAGRRNRFGELLFDSTFDRRPIDEAAAPIAELSPAA